MPRYDTISLRPSLFRWFAIVIFGSTWCWWKINSPFTCRINCDEIYFFWCFLFCKYWWSCCFDSGWLCWYSLGCSFAVSCSLLDVWFFLPFFNVWHHSNLHLLKTFLVILLFYRWLERAVQATYLIFMIWRKFEERHSIGEIKQPLTAHASLFPLVAWQWRCQILIEITNMVDIQTQSLKFSEPRNALFLDFDFRLFRGFLRIIELHCIALHCIVMLFVHESKWWSHSFPVQSIDAED